MEKYTKFKLGETVKVVKRLCSLDDKFIGITAKIIRVEDDHPFAYFLDGIYLPFLETQLELVEESEPEKLRQREEFFTDDEPIRVYEKPDMVNHPPHYTFGKPETIDLIRLMLSPEEFIGFCKGTILGYRDRAFLKGEPRENYDKAEWYYNLVKEIQNGREGD